MSILKIRDEDGKIIEIPILKGEKGDKGADGKSAYKYAQEGGYTGTEAQFTDTLTKTTNCAIFDSFPTEAQIRALPNKSYFSVRNTGGLNSNEMAIYFRTTSWRADALEFTDTDGTTRIYVVPINQAVGELYLPYYGIKTGEENAESNSTIMNILASSVQYGVTFKLPVGNFYFSEPINISDKHASILGTTAVNHKNPAKLGVTFLHFTNLKEGETALKVAQCSLSDFVISGTSEQYDLTFTRENAFNDVNTVVDEMIGIKAYGIKASGGMLIRNVGFKHFYYGCWCDTANMFITDVTFHICHYGLSLGHDSKVQNISGADIMILLQMRGSITSAIGVRGDSVGKHLVELLGGVNHTLVDLDADFCMDAIVSIGDGTTISNVRDLSITGVHGRNGIRHFFALTDEELTANDITENTAYEWGLITVQKGSSLTGAFIVANQSNYNTPFDGKEDYTTPFVLLSADAATMVSGVQFMSTSYTGDELSEEWMKKRIASLSSLPNACSVTVQSSKGHMFYTKDKGVVTVISDAQDIYKRMDKSAFALDNEVVKTVNGAYPDEGGNVIVKDEEPEVVSSSDEFTDTSKKYVLPDGYIYAYRKRFIPGGTTPNFTDQLSISKDTNLTSIYNGVGYKENMNYIDNAEAASNENDFLSGLIPVKENDVLHINYFEATLWSGDALLVCIGADGVTKKNELTKNRIKDIIPAGGSFVDDPAPDDVITGARVLSDVKIPINSTMFWNANEIAYIRICPYKHKISPEDVIVTVNQDITYTVTEDHYEWNWENTGEQYYAVDYLAMIKALEERIEKLEETL
jgi:hypothetical protein